MSELFIFTHSGCETGNLAWLVDSPAEFFMDETDNSAWLGDSPAKFACMRQATWRVLVDSPAEFLFMYETDNSARLEIVLQNLCVWDRRLKLAWLGYSPAEMHGWHRQHLTQLGDSPAEFVWMRQTTWHSWGYSFRIVWMKETASCNWGIVLQNFYRWDRQPGITGG